MEPGFADAWPFGGPDEQPNEESSVGREIEEAGDLRLLQFGSEVRNYAARRRDADMDAALALLAPGVAGHLPDTDARADQPASTGPPEGWERARSRTSRSAASTMPWIKARSSLGLSNSGAGWRMTQRHESLGAILAGTLRLRSARGSARLDVTIVVRLGSPADVEVAVSVYERSNLARRQGVWPEQASRIKHVAARLREPSSWFLLAEDGSWCVGMAAVEPMRCDAEAWAPPALASHMCGDVQLAPPPPL